MVYEVSPDIHLAARVQRTDVAAPPVFPNPDVVTKYAGLAAAAGLDWSAVQAIDEVALKRRLRAVNGPTQSSMELELTRRARHLFRKRSINPRLVG